MKKLLSEEIPREGESVDCWGNLGKYSDLEYLGEVFFHKLYLIIYREMDAHYALGLYLIQMIL